MAAKDHLKILRDLGSEFPIRIVEPASSRLMRDFELGDWTMTEEERISEAREQADMTMGLFASHVLSTLAVQLGPHRIREMKPAERMVLISGMFVADVLYAYIYTRHQFYGKALKVHFTCPACKKSCSNEVDLSELDVRCVDTDSIADLREEVMLNRPIQLEQPAARLLGVIYEPTRWAGVESLPIASASNRAKFLRAMFKSSCSGLIWEQANPEQTMPELLTDNMIDKFSKQDLELMAVAMDRINRGPILRAAVGCTNITCQVETEVNIDWSYDNFFTT